MNGWADIQRKGTSGRDSGRAGSSRGMGLSPGKAPGLLPRGLFPQARRVTSLGMPLNGARDPQQCQSCSYSGPDPARCAAPLQLRRLHPSAVSRGHAPERRLPRGGLHVPQGCRGSALPQQGWVLARHQQVSASAPPAGASREGVQGQQQSAPAQRNPPGLPCCSLNRPHGGKEDAPRVALV